MGGVSYDKICGDLEKKGDRGEETLIRCCSIPCQLPELMRAYMYAHGYRNLSLAQDLVLSLNLTESVCDDCSSCPVKCPSGFNVSSKIRNIVRVNNLPSDFFVSSMAPIPYEWGQEVDVRKGNESWIIIGGRFLGVSF